MEARCAVGERIRKLDREVERLVHWQRLLESRVESLVFEVLDNQEIRALHVTHAARADEREDFKRRADRPP